VTGVFVNPEWGLAHVRCSPAARRNTRGRRAQKERWQVERGYEQLKGELGLDYFEGRIWPGFHHHAAMTFLAYGFRALEWQQTQTTAEAPPSGEARRGA